MALNKRPYEVMSNGNTVAIRDAKTKKNVKANTNYPAYIIEPQAIECWITDLFGDELLNKKYADAMMWTMFSVKNGRDETVYKYGDKWVKSAHDCKTLRMQDVLNYNSQTNEFDLSEFLPQQPVGPAALRKLAQLTNTIEQTAVCQTLCRVVTTIEEPDWIKKSYAAHEEAGKAVIL